MAERFNVKVAFVSGGTGALGRTVVEAFYAEGAKITVTYLLEKEFELFPASLKNDHERVLLIKTNLTREDEVQAAFSKTIELYGTVDYLINNAGAYMVKASIVELDVRDWDRMMDMNLRSAFLCSRSALKVMLKNGSGRITSISAMAGPPDHLVELA